MFSSEYGWTTKQILELTFKELNARIKAIDKRNKSDVNFIAGVHGIDLKDKNEKKDLPQLNEKQEKEMQKLIQQNLSRKKHHGTR